MANALIELIPWSLILGGVLHAASQPPISMAIVHPSASRHRVNMTGNRFVPSRLQIVTGDTVDFVNGAGGPHNVAFWSDSLPQGSRDLLSRLMQDSIAPLTGSLLLEEEQTWTMAFTGVPPGRYPYFCLPHMVGGMVGEIEVRIP